MSREIKFRIWDGKTMSKPFKFKDLIYTINDDGVHFGDSNHTTFNMKNLVFMQFTKLKDKNGKEIWEGDIIHHGYFKETGEVRWDERQTAFKILWNDGQKFDLWPVDHNHYEVLGNIYENPELLGSRHDG